MKIKIVPFDDPSVAKAIKDRFTDAKSYRSQWEGQWKINEMNVFNSKGTLNISDMETGSASIAASIKAIGEGSYSLNGEDTDIGINYIMRNYRLLHSQMSANPPTVHARPATSDSEDQRRTEAANDVLRHGLRRYKMQEHIDLMNGSTLLYGTGYTITAWNPLLGDIKSFDESTGEIEMQGDIQIYSPSTWDVWLDSKARRIDDMRYFIEKLIIPSDLAQAMFPKHFEILKDQESDNSSGYRSWDSRRRDADQKTESQITVYRYYEKGMPVNAMQGRFCFLDQEGTVIGQIKHNPYQFKTVIGNKKEIESLPSACLPIHILTDIDVPAQIYGKSFVEYAALLQDVINRLDSQQLDNAKAHGNTRMVVSEDALLNTDDITTNAWDVMKVASNQPPYFVSPPSTMPDLTATRDKLRQGIDEVCGVNESMFGQTSRETSGFSMQYATNQGNMIRRRLFNKYVDITESIYKMYLNICIKYWTEPQTISVLGAEDAFNILDVRGSDIDSGYDVVIEYGTNFSLDPVLRREEILTLVPHLEKAGMTPKEIVRLLKVGDLHSGLDNMELGRKRQEEIFRTMIETHQYIKPKELQDHQAYLDYAYMYVNTAEYRDLEEIEQQLINKHIKDREEMAASKAAPQAGQAPAAPPAGGMPPMGGGMPPMPMG